MYSMPLGMTELVLSRIVYDQLKKFAAPIKSLIKTHMGATIYHSCILKTIKIDKTSTNDNPIYEYKQKLNKPIALESLADSIRFRSIRRKQSAI